MFWKIAIGLFILYLSIASFLGLYLFIKENQKDDISFNEISVIAYFPNKVDLIKYKHRLEKGIKYSNDFYAPTHIKFVLKDCVITDYVPVYTGDEDQQEWMAKSDSVISVYSVDKIILEEKENYVGIAFSKDYKKYSAIIFSFERSDATLAHEFGHLFGLDHNENEYNIMHPTIYLVDHIIDPEQLEVIKKNAMKFLQQLDHDPCNQCT
jgi:hypothetical protein